MKRLIKQIPKRILIIGLLLCYVGLMDIWETIHYYMTDRAAPLNLLAIITLFIGIGLLRGNPIARVLTVIIIAYVCIVFSIILINSIITPQQYEDITWWIRLNIAVILVLFISMACLLYSKKASNYFKYTPSPPT